MNFPPVLRNIISSFEFLFRLATAEIKRNTAGTFLGIAWLVIYPLIFVCCYAFVIIFIYRSVPSGYTPIAFVAFIFQGLVPFLATAETIGSAPTAYISARSLVRDFDINISYLPFKVSILSIINMLPGVVMLIAISVIEGNISTGILILPIVIVSHFTLNAGISLIFSTLTVFFRDIARIAPILNMLLMFVTPIGFSSNLQNKLIEFILYLNPLTSAINAYRSALTMNLQQSILPTFVLVCFSMFLFAIGSFLNYRLKKLIPDYV
jgi:lipopolysaccharide transport system permease protein